MAAGIVRAWTRRYPWLAHEFTSDGHLGIMRAAREFTGGDADEFLEFSKRFVFRALDSTRRDSLPRGLRTDARRPQPPTVFEFDDKLNAVKAPPHSRPEARAEFADLIESLTAGMGARAREFIRSFYLDEATPTIELVAQKYDVSGSRVYLVHRKFIDDLKPEIAFVLDIKNY